MAVFFPARRPSVGLSFTPSAIRLAAVRRFPFRTPRIRSVKERPLPPGLLAPALDAPHIQDVDRFVKELSALMGRGRNRAVGVSLPDEAAALRLLSFEQLPSRAAERETLIRWRLQQDTTMPSTPRRLWYRIYPGHPLIHVLAAVPNEPAFAQYEQVWNATGLLPMSVGCETLLLFDSLRRAMTAGPDYGFVHCGETAVTVLAVRQWTPVFLRRKPAPPQHGAVMEDIVGTVQYCEDRFPRRQPAAAMPLYWVETHPAAEPQVSLEGGARCAGQAPVNVVPILDGFLPATAELPALTREFFTAAASVGAA
jgi:hypothetical protein